MEEADRERMELSLWELYIAFSTKLPRILAVDFGLRNTGVASFFPSFSRSKLQVSLDDPSLCKKGMEKKNMTKISTREAREVGIEYARFLSNRMGPGDNGQQCLCLLETQPPSKVTGGLGRTTRAFATAIEDAMMYDGSFRVESRTVCKYKRTDLGFIVHKDRDKNKKVSKGIARILKQYYPDAIDGPEEWDKNADMCDALLLLLSELVEWVRCQDIFNCRTSNSSQHLMLVMFLLEYDKNRQDSEWMNQFIQDLSDNRLHQLFCELSYVQPVGMSSVALSKRKTRKNGISGVKPHAVSTPVSPLIISPMLEKPSNPLP